MSAMEKKRDEVGKVLACLLVSRKGLCTISDLEKDYLDTEGRGIPYTEFGCCSILDFFRTIDNHVQLETRLGQYVLRPVVSDKIKHVNELVRKQKLPRQTSNRRRMERCSRYFPQMKDQKPFIPNIVQQEIAKILTENPSGVNKTYIAQRLEDSGAVSGRINVDNVDDYLKSMPYIANSSGHMVYPSRSLAATPQAVRRRTQLESEFEMVTPRNSTAPAFSNNNILEQQCSYEDDEEEVIYSDDQFDDKYTLPTSTNLYESQQLINSNNECGPKSLSAEFNSHSRSQSLRSRCDESSRENSHFREEYDDVEYRGEKDLDLEESYVNPDITYQSDNNEMDIINPRLKSRLQELMKKHPDGIWCADFLQAYLDEYKVNLDYNDLGFGSVCAFASKVPSVFRVHRWNTRGDFILYDATKPLPPAVVEPNSEIPDYEWENDFDDDDVEPFPPALLQSQELFQKLIPSNVLTHGESVGQERIPENPDCLNEFSELLEVYVSDVYTPSLFWIHLRRKRHKLNQLMNSMHEFYQAKGDDYTIPRIVLEKGLNCACTFDDKWHRAIIKNVKLDGDVTLNFYDYGTTKTYPPECLRFLDRRYSNLPAQAIACGLYNVKPVNSDMWTRGVSLEFYNKVEDLPLFAMVVTVDRDNNSMMVSLVDTQNPIDLHINDWLVQQGLAESGFMVRSRPPNFLLRYYLACLEHHLRKTIKIQKLRKAERVKLKSFSHIEVESTSNSKIILKSANHIKNFMAKYSKYKRNSTNNNPTDVESRDPDLKCSSDTLQEVNKETKSCSTNDSQTVVQNSRNLGENRTSKILRYKPNLISSKQNDDKITPTTNKTQCNISEQSENISTVQNYNDSSVMAQPVKHSSQVSEDSNSQKNSEPRTLGPESNEGNVKLNFFGTFRSHYGGHGHMEPTDWAKIRSDESQKQATVVANTKPKSQVIPESSLWKLNEETKEGACQGRNEYKDDSSLDSSHRGMTSNSQEVNAKPIGTTIEKKILPAMKCFINAVRSNKDHYHRVKGEKLWWSTEGNVQSKPGVITPLLRQRIKNSSQVDIDSLKVNISPEILKILRGEKSQGEPNGPSSKDVSDPDINFITQLKKPAVPSDCNENEKFNETSTPLKDRTSESRSRSVVTKSNSSPVSQNVNETRSTSNSLSNTRFATILNYMNRPKTQSESSATVHRSLPETSDTPRHSDIVPPTTNADSSSSLVTSHPSKKIPNSQSDIQILSEQQSNDLTDAAKDYQISSNINYSGTNTTSTNYGSSSKNVKASAVSSPNSTISHSSNNPTTEYNVTNKSNRSQEPQSNPVEVTKENYIDIPKDLISTDSTSAVENMNTSASEKCTESTEVPEANKLIEISSSSLSENQNTEATAMEVNSGYTADNNVPDVLKHSQQSLTRPEKKKTYAIHGDTHSSSELDSDDLSSSCSHSEAELLQVCTKKSNVDTGQNTETDIDMEISRESKSQLDKESLDRSTIISSDEREDIFEQLAPHNIPTDAGDDEQIASRVPINESKVSTSIYNDLDATSDSDEWDVEGDWKEFTKDRSDIMSRVVQKLEDLNNLQKSAKHAEINDEPEPEPENLDARQHNNHEQIIRKFCSKDESNWDEIQNQDYNEVDESITKIKSIDYDRNLTDRNVTVSNNISKNSLGSLEDETVISHNNVTTFLEKQPTTNVRRSKMRSMRDMMEKMKSRQNLVDMYKISDKSDNNLNLDEQTNASVSNESEMLTGFSDASSSRKGSITCISNNKIDNKYDCEIGKLAPRQNDISNNNSESSSGDAAVFVEELANISSEKYSILSTIKKQRLTVKSPINEEVIRNESYTDQDLDLQWNSPPLHESSETNILSRSLLEKIKLIYSSKK